jgi:hypothetical protein
VRAQLTTVTFYRIVRRTGYPKKGDRTGSIADWKALESARILIRLRYTLVISARPRNARIRAGAFLFA